MVIVSLSSFVGDAEGVNELEPLKLCDIVEEKERDGEWVMVFVVLRDGKGEEEIVWVTEIECEDERETEFDSEGGLEFEVLIEEDNDWLGDGE
jgi:hypothetical protein